MSTIHNDQPPVTDTEIQTALYELRCVEPAYSNAWAARSALAQKMAQLELILGYYSALSTIRRVGNSYELWPIGVTLVAPSVVGAVVWAITFTFHVGIGLSSFLTAMFVIVTLISCLYLLWLPTNNTICRKLSELYRDRDYLQDRLSAATARLREAEVPYLNAKAKHNALVHCLNAWHQQKREEHQRWIRSIQYQQEQLCASNWRALRSVEFELFLKNVFEVLGCHVETTKLSGDQGVDLIVHYGSKKVAVQVKGYHSSVGNDSVQQAFAGCSFYQCHVCAVITNSRFTSSARELADRVGCILVDENSMQDLIMGRIAFG